MSNTDKIMIVAITIAVIGAISIFLVDQNREQKVVTTSSSQVVSSIKSLVVSSSSQSQVVSSSFVTPPSSTVSSIKIESQDIQYDKFKFSLDKDIVFKTGINLKSDEFKLYNTESNVSLLNQISNDYFLKVKSNFISNQPFIYINNSSKVSKTEFEISISMIDEDYFKTNKKSYGQNPNRLNATYQIYKQSDSEWVFKFIDFTFNPDGSRINE